jgi:hypothetical protein
VKFSLENEIKPLEIVGFAISLGYLKNWQILLNAHFFYYERKWLDSFPSMFLPDTKFYNKIQEYSEGDLTFMFLFKEKKI